jgi:transposase-like protein
MSLLSFLKRFPDDDACWSHLEAVRWPQGPVCPKCGSVGDAHLVGRAHYRRCNACRTKFKVTHGTPFEGTHLPMRAWFTALYLVAASSKGVSSVKLGEHLGVGQKTAWFLGQRIRRMMEANDGLLSGIVHLPRVTVAPIVSLPVNDLLRAALEAEKLRSKRSGDGS